MSKTSFSRFLWKKNSKIDILKIVEILDKFRIKNGIS